MVPKTLNQDWAKRFCNQLQALAGSVEFERTVSVSRCSWESKDDNSFVQSIYHHSLLIKQTNKTTNPHKPQSMKRLFCPLDGTVSLNAANKAWSRPGGVLLVPAG